MTDVDTAPDELGTESLFSLLGSAHTLDVIYAIITADDPPVRFTQLQDRLDVSPNTLSRRLDELETVGLVVRRSYDEIPPRVEYELTDDGRELAALLEPLVEWERERGKT